jgi:16S rRNA A1518/A1519 N6-dimethyltransferase RsmA/KsgA/DIM1 with predicted DNA glycosylase/AP lyase activity
VTVGQEFAGNDFLRAVDLSMGSSQHKIDFFSGGAFFPPPDVQVALVTLRPLVKVIQPFFFFCHF